MLAVVYHAGRGLPAEQSMTLQLWDLHSRKTQPTKPLPLSGGDGVTLRWLGYATNGVLCSCDSSGVVRALLVRLPPSLPAAVAAAPCCARRQSAGRRPLRSSSRRWPLPPARPHESARQ
eukprot:SAG11_NODE_12558_length_697_cov_1.053512_1_plen_119_part_00